MSIEYADSLNKLLDEELPNELKGTYDDLELRREVHTPFDFSKMDLGKVKGFFPVISNISPFDDIKSFLKRGE